MFFCVFFSVVLFNWRLIIFEVDSFLVLEQSYKWFIIVVLYCEKDEDSVEKVILSFGLKCIVFVYFFTQLSWL